MNKRARFEWPLTVRLREGRTNGTDLRWSVGPIHIEAADEIDRVNDINADLLEALRAIVMHPSYAESEDGETGEPCELIAECRAAIAKAEGKE